MKNLNLAKLSLDVDIEIDRSFRQSESDVERTFDAAIGADLHALRSLLNGWMGMLMFHLRTPMKETNEVISYQLALACSFFRTQQLIFRLLRAGNIIEAATLLRHQIEVLSRMKELDIYPIEKLKKRTPNIKEVLKGSSGRIYAELSEIAHFADSGVMGLLLVSIVGDKAGPSHYPAYHERSLAYWEVGLFVSLVFCLWLQFKVDLWRPEAILDREQVLGLSALRMASELGIYGKAEMVST